MVKFDHSGHTVSMKMSHLEHCKAKGPQTNADRNLRRKSSSMARLQTM